MQYASNQMLTSLLRDVSRSFYLTLRVLPSGIRSQIGLAYLLARTSDTVADTELVPLDQRLSLLRALRHRISGASTKPLELGDLLPHQASTAERALLERCETSLKLLSTLTVADHRRVVETLEIITSGQELDLLRFSGSSADKVIALRSPEELDDYTYRVAGCVGEFWTRMCRAHLFPTASLDDDYLLSNGVRFGKGLQLVNILRDLAVDLSHGRCYLPGDQLKEAGLLPGDLLRPSAETRLRPLYNKYLDIAQAHLSAGWDYTNHLPWSSGRVRLACAWPLLIGRRTVDLLRSGEVLELDKRLKVSRAEVKALLWRSVLYYPWPGRWKRLFGGRSNTH